MVLCCWMCCPKLRLAGVPVPIVGDGEAMLLVERVAQGVDLSRLSDHRGVEMRRSDPVCFLKSCFG